MVAMVHEGSPGQHEESLLGHVVHELYLHHSLSVALPKLRARLFHQVPGLAGDEHLPGVRSPRQPLGTDAGRCTRRQQRHEIRYSPSVLVFCGSTAAMPLFFALVFYEQ